MSAILWDFIEPQDPLANARVEMIDRLINFRCAIASSCRALD